MPYSLTYRSINKFPLRSRFFENAEKCTLVPEEDRFSFKPLSEESSRSHWHGWVDPILGGLDRENPTFDEGSEKGWEEEVRRQLRNHVNVPDAELLYFFWEPTIAVRTKWGMLLKYWNNFCYPSDARNVAILPMRSQAIVYSNKRLWIVPCMDAPYTRDEIDQLAEDASPWRVPYCGKCRNHVPKFAALSPEDEKRLKSLPPVEAFKELLEKTGCSVLWAKIWVSHPHGPHPSGPPCPYCGKPLRTEKARQCCECGADWHGQVPKEE